MGVGDDRDLAADEREPHQPADLRPVARVVRVHRHRRVAQHGLRPRRRDDELAGAVGQRIGDLPELALRVLVVLDLEVRERRLAARRTS